MPSKEPTTERNLDGYGAPAIAWNRVRNQLDKGFTQAPGSGGPNRHTVWLSTVNPDGRPHVMPLGALWIGGDFYFTSGPGTRKSQNLARNPHCVLSVATEPFDLDRRRRRTPWYLYELTPATVYALGTAEPYGATRFRF